MLANPSLTRLSATSGVNNRIFIGEFVSALMPRKKSSWTFATPFLACVTDY